MTSTGSASGQRPAPFSDCTTPEFWDDDHISGQMLRFHLDPVAEPASRAHAFIDRSVDWLIPNLGLGAGSRLVDLGCGPGLYANRLAARGVQVLGIDVSRRSLAFAREVARDRSLPAAFRQGNYLTCDLGADQDAAILIYEDYCALSPGQRALLLSRVHAALRPGGLLAFDVTAAPRFDQYREEVVREPDLMGGFWAEPPYVGTHETWTYPDLRLVLDRYLIETVTGTRCFWNWMQCLWPEEVAAEVAAAGFGEPEFFGDVAGAAFDRSAPTFTVLVGRPRMA
ncbi:MAG TPA: methyltransferase domain-containing protein [Propionicimonas sp.]|uniref:SAM-dependent methyltransferase n=1 Tax=Propionicimonas sp. TaxID=1955623 RepID=UPI002F40D114